MKSILYSNGDSVVWGAELKNKFDTRFSNLLSQNLNCFDCNKASAGVSNDYIYRTTIRDISHWLKTKNIWSEKTDWIHSNNVYVVIGWTAPTRNEIWNGFEFNQYRDWLEFDMWGVNDKNKKTDNQIIKYINDIIPSYIKTFNYIITLSAFLEKFNIPYYFFNIFYNYTLPNEPKNLIDPFGNYKIQHALSDLYNLLPNSFKEENMYDFLFENGGTFLERKHPSEKSHKIFSDYIFNKINFS